MKDWQRHLRSHALGVALVFSLAVHAVILAIKFAPDIQKRLKDNMPALEVVLVNSKTKSAPSKADVLAQANLDRGGNTDADRRMKSPLPVTKSKPVEVTAKLAAENSQKASKAAERQAEETQKQQRVAELEKQAQELMTQLQAKQVVESKSIEAAATPKTDNGQGDVADPTNINVTELAARSLNMARREAEISKEWDNYQKRPKRMFVGARTREYKAAAYVESFRQKVEKIGMLNFPAEAAEKKLYGARLVMTVNIKADGSIESIELNQSSGYKVLDDSARRIVELSAPFSEIPMDIRKHYDIISITKTWTFTQEDTFASQ